MIKGMQPGPRAEPDGEGPVDATGTDCGPDGHGPPTS